MITIKVLNLVVAVGGALVVGFILGRAGRNDRSYKDGFSDGRRANDGGLFL